MKCYASCRIGRFIGMEFIKQRVAGMIRVAKRFQFFSQRFDLYLIEYRYAGEIAVLPEECNLFF